MPYLLVIFLLCFPFLIGAESFSTVSQLREKLEQKKGTSNPDKPLTLLNVSYDPTRELYEEINRIFPQWWKEKTGQEVTILQSHGGSGKQARAVTQGLEADVVTLALALDIDSISKNTPWLSPDWRKRLPNRSVPFTSTVVFLVREGNPKGIKDWDDLIKEGVSIITPNPKTSGGARWNYLAAWGYALKKYKGDESQTKEFMRKLFKNVPILDVGARGSTTTFVQREIGDVLLTWENEAHLAINELGQEKFDIIIPSVSIKAEPPVAWVDTVVDKKGTRDAAEYYLAFLYTKTGQDLAAKHYYRPIDPGVFQTYSALFPTLPLFDIEKDFGGWEQAQRTHFQDGGVFDQIYTETR